MCNLPIKPGATEAVGLMGSSLFTLRSSNMQTLLKYALIIPETVRNTLGSFDEEREMILLKAFEVTETGHCVPSVIYNSSTQDGCRTFGCFF